MKKATNTYITLLGFKFTIKERNGRYHIAFSYKGKRINRTTGLEITKDNLKIIKDVIIKDIAQELLSKQQTMPNNICTDDILDNFAQTHFELLKGKLREHVYKRNLSNFKNHILPYFKGRKISSIKPIELEYWQNKLLKTYKPSSLQKYRSIFYSIFERAYQNDLINKNPLNLVHASKISDFSCHEAINPFTQKEIDILLQSKGYAYMPNFIKLMSNTGMRPGEIIALKWEDIDFENKSINVNKTIINGKEGLPKTRSSIRTIDMIKGAQEALSEQYKLTSKYEHVFINSEKQRFYSHDVININLKKMLIKNNIEIRPLYQFRHSFASRMIKSGIDIIWVSNMLGHKDSSITLQVYTKFIKEDRQTRIKNIEKINGLLQ